MRIVKFTGLLLIASQAMLAHAEVVTINMTGQVSAISAYQPTMPSYNRYVPDTPAGIYDVNSFRNFTVGQTLNVTLSVDSSTLNIVNAVATDTGGNHNFWYPWGPGQAGAGSDSNPKLTLADDHSLSFGFNLVDTNGSPNSLFFSSNMSFDSGTFGAPGGTPSLLALHRATDVLSPSATSIQGKFDSCGQTPAVGCLVATVNWSHAVVATVPENGSVALMGLGLAATALAARRRTRPTATAMTSQATA